MTAEQLESRRAIEALRAGVPNRDAVRALGCSQPEIESRFLRCLDECQEAAERHEQAKGLMVAADFGAGKSHLLEYLQHLALESNFVASKVVISKETPLFDPAKLFLSAVDSAIAPGQQGNALREVAQRLDQSPGFPAFYDHVLSDGAGLDRRFGASLCVYANARSTDLEWTDRVVSFWCGRKLNVTEVNRALKQLGQGGPWRFAKIANRELALQRFRFAAMLMRAAGYAGWVLLLDEAELIGRYSLRQRAKSYAELARWMGALKAGSTFPGIVSVLAITPDFETAILDEKGDSDSVRARLTVTGSPEELLAVGEAEAGMRQIRSAVRLRQLDGDQISQVVERLRHTYHEAYGWCPPPADCIPRRPGSTPMRSYIRRWVTEWDLERLFPAYAPDVETAAVDHTLEEDRDLERASEANHSDEP